MVDGVVDRQRCRARIAGGEELEANKERRERERREVLSDALVGHVRVVCSLVPAKTRQQTPDNKSPDK